MGSWRPACSPRLHESRARDRCFRVHRRTPLPTSRRRRRGGHAISRRPQEDDSVRWWQADLGDADEVAATFGQVRPDVVYHLAGFVSGSREVEAVLPSLRDNLVSAVNVLVAAARIGCSVVLAGSQEEPEPGWRIPFPLRPMRPPSSPSAPSRACFTRCTDFRSSTFASSWSTARGSTTARSSCPTSSPRFFERSSRSFRVEPARSTGSTSTTWSTRSSRHPPGTISPARPWTSARELVTIRAIVERIVETVGTGSSPTSEPSRASTRDRPGRRRRADEGPPRLAARTTLADGLRSTVDWYRAELERENEFTA